jgi:putative tricarboxylic transport membrane protein
MLVFAICGYFMKKADIPAAPMLMALIMGPMLERNLYQALNLAHGNVLVFVQRPISATLLSILVLTSIFVAVKRARGGRTVQEAEE